jgi:hypothetical protein
MCRAFLCPAGALTWAVNFAGKAVLSRHKFDRLSIQLDCVRAEWMVSFKKNRLTAVLKFLNAAKHPLLLDLRFLVDHVFPNNRIVFPDFHFLRMQPLIFVRGVVVTGTGRRY